jgi:hypothetical protein
MKILALRMLTTMAATGLLVCSLQAAPRPSTMQRKTSLSMRDAIRIAEQYLEREKIDVSDKFLNSVRYDHVGPWTKGTAIGKGPLWLLHWETYPISGPGGIIAVFVYMDGKVGHFHGI